MSKILVIEEEPHLRRLYERELAQDGDLVLTAGTGVGAVQAFEAEHPDLVVLNVGPPPNDGLRIVERMLAADRRVPIVLNSTSRCYEDEPLGWAVDAYVIKSADTRELCSKVHELLAR